MQGVRITALISFLVVATTVFAQNKVIIGTLSSFKRPDKLGEVFRDNDADSFDDIESHIRQGASLFAKRYCPAEIEIRDYNTEGTIEGSIKAIHQAEKDGAKLLIGFVSSGPILAVNKLLPQRRIPVLSVMASHMDVARRDPPTLQMSYNDVTQGKSLAEIVLGLPPEKQKKVLLLTEATNPYSVSLSSEIKTRLAIHQPALKEYEYATPMKWPPKGWNLEDFRNATAIVMTGEGREVLEVVSHVSKINTAYVLIGGDGWYRGNVTQYLPPTGIYIPDTITVGHWTPKLPDRNSKEFGAAYSKAFKHDPGGTAGLAHDAIKVACAVWKKKHMFSFDSLIGEGVDGLTGPIHFDSQGRQDKEKPLIYTFSDGKYTYAR